MSGHGIAPERSKLAVAGQAPGHRFTAEGFGVEGHLDLDGERMAALSASFPLGRLDAGDLLKNRELAKFLELDRNPVARAELLAPVTLTREASGALRGQGRVRFSIGARSMESTVVFAAVLPRATARFTLTFRGFGYEPPKLLFLRMKDELDVEVTAELTTEATVG